MSSTDEPKVVSFLSEKEERKISEGKVYADRARAKKRERKERYKARKAEERQEQMSNEEAATQMLRELGSEHGSGTIDSIVGNTFLENSIPEEFRAEFDAIVDAYAPEVDVPDFSAPKGHSRGAAEGSGATSSRHARPGPGSSAARRRLAEAAKGGSDEDDDGDAADNEDDETAGDLACQDNAFEAALRNILRPGAKGGDAGDKKEPAKLAGDDAATKRIRMERAARKEAAEKTKLKKMIMNKAHVVPDITKQDDERRLRLLATRGVVRLFNAISQHQAKVAKEKGKGKGGFEEKKLKLSKGIKRGNENSSESGSGSDSDSGAEPSPKRGKGLTPLTNEDFLNLLKKNSTGGAAARSFMLPKAITETKVDTKEIERKVKEEKEREEEEEDEEMIGLRKKNAANKNGDKGIKWGALKDDFMLGAKLRDWRKNADEENNDDDI